MAGAFGKELRKRRLAARKTLKEVADFLGVSIPYVSDVELGRRQPFTGPVIESLARFFGCTDPEVDSLRLSALKDRGEITLAAPSESKRQMLVALDRRMQNLDESTVKQIKRLLDEGATD